MKPIKYFQKALNLLNAIILIYVKDDNINKANEQLDVLQELIDYCDKLEKALNKACMELEVAESMLHKYTKGIKFSKEQWREYLLNETN